MEIHPFEVEGITASTEQYPPDVRKGGIQVKHRGNQALKVLRIFIGMQQLEVASRIHADQSTVSRIENGDVFVSADMEWSFITACGGGRILQTLIDHLQSLLDRYRLSNDRLLPA